MKPISLTHPHRALANLLDSQAQDADLLNLSHSIARFLELEWKVPINSAEVQFAIREWTKTNRSPVTHGAGGEVTRITMPGKQPAPAARRELSAGQVRAEFPFSVRSDIPDEKLVCDRCLSGSTEHGPGGVRRCLDCGDSWTAPTHQA